MLRTSLALAASLAALLAVPVSASASAERYVAGAPGAGDPFFPQAGNGGYDVRHYDRGAMTLQALRQKVRDRMFFAERKSGRDLGAFFDVWLFQEGRPQSW